MEITHAFQCSQVMTIFYFYFLPTTVIIVYNMNVMLERRDENKQILSQEKKFNT